MAALPRHDLEHLIARLCAGQDPAWAEFIEAFAPLLLAVARATERDPDHAATPSCSPASGSVNGTRPVSRPSTSRAPDGQEVVDAFTYYPPDGGPVQGSGRRERAKPRDADGGHQLTGWWRIKKLEQISDSVLTWTFKSAPGGMTMRNVTGEWYEAKFDGKEYPIHEDRAGTSVSIERVDDARCRKPSGAMARLSAPPATSSPRMVGRWMCSTRTRSRARVNPGWGGSSRR